MTDDRDRLIKTGDGATQHSAVSAQHSGMTRRQFLLAVGATSVGAVMFTGCAAPGHKIVAQSRGLLAEDILTGYENWYATTCRQCEAGCGVITRVIEGRARKLEGNPDHPLNRGKLCARGQAGVQEQYHPDRVREPMLRTGERGAGEFTPISWEEALNDLAVRLRDLQQRGQAEQVAFLTRPLRGHQGLLVDRFTRAYGAQWLRLDPLAEPPLHEAVERVFGQQLLPRFDIERAQYILSFGADFLSTWQSPVHYGVGYGIFRQGNYYLDEFQPRHQAQRPRGYMAHLEPRFSATAANADEWVPIRPGSEGQIALSMAQVILTEGLADQAGAAAFGSPEALQAFEPEQVAAETGVSAERIRQLARDFAERRPSLALAGGPASAHTNATDNLAAVLALNLLVGNVGQPGGVLFNPPPPIEDLPMPFRPSSLADWHGLAEALRAGQVQAVLLHAANPVHDLPGAMQFRQALAQAPYVVSFSSFMDDTAALADLVLPSHLQLEDWGSDVPEPGPGLSVITLQQPVVPPIFDTRSFSDVLLTLAEELGGPVQQELPWPTVKEMLREAARDLQQLGRGSVQHPNFERFWVQLLQQGGWWEDEPAQAAAPAAAPAIQDLAADIQPPEFAGTDTEFPFHLVVFPHNTLGAGQTAHLPWLQATPDPISSAVWQTWVEVNPRVAEELGLREGDIVAIESPHGEVEVPVYIHPAANPTVLAMPLGQGHTAYGRWAEERGVNPMALLAPLTDQITGALAHGATRVRLTRTARRMTLPKLEGTVPAIPIPDHEIVKVTREA